MQPFLELPIVIANNEQKEKDVIARVDPNEIEYYYPGFYDGTVIVMKSCSSFITKFSVEDLDSALAAYYGSVKANAGKFGNCKLTPKTKLHASN